MNAVLSLENYETRLGLSGMRERTHLSGGSFSIKSVKGIGTTIRASWPLAENR
jgi:signal transduction histidine kinase